jgi:hypothetical protein
MLDVEVRVGYWLFWVLICAENPELCLKTGFGLAICLQKVCKSGWLNHCGD